MKYRNKRYLVVIKHGFNVLLLVGTSNAFN